jgi:hypothetical protein
MPEPLSDLAVSEAKLLHYLLDPAHSVGGPKAVFFIGQGFSPDSPADLARALIEHTAGATLRRTQTQFGEKLIFEGAMHTPSGRSPLIRSVWLRQPSGTAHLVTAYPI